MKSKDNIVMKVVSPLRNIFTIFLREFTSYFNSLTAYVVMGSFVVLIGLFFWFFGETVLTRQSADLDDLFFGAPFLLMILTPLITMRAFAEEFRAGTIELLATRPVSDVQILVGKYLAANCLILLTLVPSLLYFLTLNKLAFPAGIIDGNLFSMDVSQQNAFLPTDRLDNGPILGAYLGMLALGTMFTGIGILASTITDNVIVAFILGFSVCAGFYLGFFGLSFIEVLDGVQHFGIYSHYLSIQKGVLDSRDVAYFISFDIVALLLAKIVLTLRKK